MFLFQAYFFSFSNEYITDSFGTKIYEKKCSLKGGYELIVAPIIIDNINSYIIVLEKDGNYKTLDIGIGFADNFKYYPRVPNIDFSNYFFLEYFNGTLMYHIFSKETGKLMGVYKKGPVDIENELFISVTENHVFLHDYVRNIEYNLSPYIENVGYEACIGFWNCISIDNVTDNEILLTYTGSYDKNGEDIVYSFSIQR